MATRTSPIIIIAAVLFVAGTVAVILTHQQTDSTTSKPVSSAASSSELDVKVKNIIIDSKPAENTVSKNVEAQKIELEDSSHVGNSISNPTTSKPKDIPPSSNSR